LANFSKKAVSGTIWMFSGSFGKQVINLLVYMILARILVPADIGAIAIAASIIAILQVFAELGISVAIVRQKDISTSCIDSGFVATFFSTSLIVILLWSCSQIISRFFNIPILTNLIKIAAFSYMFRGIFSLYRSLMLREMRYHMISMIEFISVFIAGITIVILANYGYGAYSIVIGQVIESALLLLWSVYLTKYIPKSLGSIKDMWNMFTFGVWVSLSRILGQSSGHLDKFLIGKLLDSTTLGGYYIAQRLVMTVPAIFTMTIDQVMLPIYSRWQNDEKRIQDGYWKGMRYSAIIVFPVTGILFVFAKPIMLILFGDKWVDFTPIVRILSIFGALQGMGGGIFASVIYAVGRPKIITLVSVFRIIVLPLCVAVGSLWGIIGVAYGTVIFGIIARLFNQYLLTFFLNYKFVKFFNVLLRPLLIICPTMLFSASLLTFIPTQNILFTALALSACVMLTILFYSFLCLKLLRQETFFIFNELKSKIFKSNDF